MKHMIQKSNLFQAFITTLKSISRVIDLFQTSDKREGRNTYFQNKM